MNLEQKPIYKIPKIIHHVWPGDDLFKYTTYRFSWMRFHPDWTFNFWRLDNLPKNIDKRVLAIANNPKYSVVVKSDIIRFEILRLLGGLYVDTDMECLKKFDELLNDDMFIGYTDEYNNVCPSLIGCVPNNDIIKETIENSLDSISKHTIVECNKSAAHISGVIPFQKAVYNNLDKIKIYPIPYFYPVHFLRRHELQNKNNTISYSKHYWTGSDPDGWTNAKYDE